MQCVALIVSVTVVAGVVDFQRFDNARQLMAYLGLTPSEHSSGASVWRGERSLRRAAVLPGGHRLRARGAIGYRPASARSSVPGLRYCRRRSATSPGKGCSGCASAIVNRHLVAAGKAKVVIIKDIAREMAGFIWPTTSPDCPGCWRCNDEMRSQRMLAKWNGITQHAGRLRKGTRSAPETPSPAC